MNTVNDNNISLWIQRFLDGETTCAEERELYAYFSREDIPEEVKPYRAMFGWYDSLASSANTTATPAATTSVSEKETPVRLPAFRPWQWISVAAMLALLLTVGFLFRPKSSMADIPEEYLAYQGSYIVRDGKKITDLRIVVPEILKTEQYIDDRINSVDEAIDINQAMIESMSSQLDMSNPAIREAVEAAFKD